MANLISATHINSLCLDGLKIIHARQKEREEADYRRYCSEVEQDKDSQGEPNRETLTEEEYQVYVQDRVCQGYMRGRYFNYAEDQEFLIEKLKRYSSIFRPGEQIEVPRWEMDICLAATQGVMLSVPKEHR